MVRHDFKEFVGNFFDEKTFCLLALGIRSGGQLKNLKYGMLCNIFLERSHQDNEFGLNFIL